MTTPLQNRVTPFGELIATPARGLFMGNRGGVLHWADRTLGPRRWVSPRWIVCRLDMPKGRRAAMAPDGTELLFLDEATALAAGHRPCAQCRREAFDRYRAAWAEGHGLAGPPTADEIDARLHRERIDPDPGARTVALATVPDGAFVALPDDPGTAWLRLDDMLLRWTPEGYAERRPRPAGAVVRLLTPPSTAAALRAGYRPVLHPTATGDPART